MTIMLRLILLFGVITHISALESGFYHIQNVASGKNVEVRQQGLPLFIPTNSSLLPHGSHEKDYTTWCVDKRMAHNATPMYTFENKAIKMFVQAYQETHNTTILIAEKEATHFELEFIRNHEWVIKLPGSGTKKVWTMEGPYDQQVFVESVKTTREGIPRVTQRFKLRPVRV